MCAAASLYDLGISGLWGNTGALFTAVVVARKAVRVSFPVLFFFRSFYDKFIFAPEIACGKVGTRNCSFCGRALGS